MKFGVIILLAPLFLAGCGGNSSNVPPAADQASLASTPKLASTSDIVISDGPKGPTPFIGFARLTGSALSSLKSITYVIAPKLGKVSRPAKVSYTMDALSRRGDFSPGQVLLPLFGLYADYRNFIIVQLEFNDSSIQNQQYTLQTAAYSDPNGVYDQVTFIKRRTAGTELGFDFFAMKSNLGTPVIVDTDGEIRWIGPGNISSFSSVYTDNGFVAGDQHSTTVYRLELDGSVATSTLQSPTFLAFHHNVDAGKTGFLGEFNTSTDTESTIGEFTPATGLTKQWDIASLLSDYMVSQGDDPSRFIRHGVDWFHSNAATYDPRDNSLIVSSRENFVMKIGYDTGEIIWILGDPTKYWYTFPSLRAKALTIESPGLYPIGQHATSITSDGLVMVFNDGFKSLNQPAGVPAGNLRNYSVVSAYSIDPVSMTAKEVWSFDYGQKILSSFCGSAYEAGEKSVLISYAIADNGTHARLVGLDQQKNVIFDFQYPNKAGCDTSWNAVPVNLEDMSFQ